MINQYEWMLLNGDRLANAIKAHEGMRHPEVDKILDEVQPLDSSGRTREQARRLLKQKLNERGAGHLFEL